MGFSQNTIIFQIPFAFRLDEADHGGQKQPTEAYSTGHQSSRTSEKQMKDGNQTVPVATSSPYEEKNIDDTDILHVGDINSQRKKPKKSAGRVGLSDKSMVENKSDGRRSSVKSGSRLSKTRPRQYNYSSSEESYPTNRPDRLNSSVYSEQDRVPSLINHPKSNAYLTRHRPNTAESNLDSGFVGSEGTMKSQDLSNSATYPIPKLNRRPTTLRTEAVGEQQSRTGLMEHHHAFRPPSSVEASENRKKEGPRRSLKRDNSVDRLSSGTRNSAERSHHKAKADSPDNARTSSQIKNPSSRLRETSRRKSMVDDVISLHTSPETQTDASFRRLPVTAERSPFLSSLRAHDVEDSPKNAISPEDERYARSTRSSLTTYTDPRKTAYHSVGESRGRRSDSGGRDRISKNGHQGDGKLYDEGEC